MQTDPLFAKKQNVGSLLGNPNITAAVKPVILMHVVQHKTFFNNIDHLALLIRKETAAIVNCIGDHFSEELKERMVQSPFSIMLDGSSNTSLQKMYPGNSPYITC